MSRGARLKKFKNHCFKKKNKISPVSSILSSTNDMKLRDRSNGGADVRPE